MTTFNRTVFELCEEVDKWKEEALYWKNEYERIRNEYSETNTKIINQNYNFFGKLFHHYLEKTDE